MTETLAPALVWTGERFERDVLVTVGDDGRIADVARDASGVEARSLPHRALLPGLVNAHSHAFQRGLRGKGERFAEGAGSFWSWREAMYALVDAMDEDKLHDLSLRAFREMLAAGITTVGEFHYLHHDESRRGYGLDRAVLAAAKEAGIRIALLSAYYNTGSIGKRLSTSQERFRSRTPAEYWDSVDRLATNLDARTQSVGCVVHSIRAATLDDLADVHAESRRRELPFHMHVEEQRKEIADCFAAYDRAPLELLAEELEIDARFTAVHCTHTDERDMEAFLDAGGNVCLCPLTEANLGDGIADVRGMLEHGGALALGTDSNARISMVEEMRWLEYVPRLAHEVRGVCLDEDGRNANPLLHAATRGGARSLGLPVGAIEAGAHADFATLDLEADELAGCDADTLLDAWIFGGGNRSIAEVCVGGRWI